MKLERLNAIMRASIVDPVEELNGFAVGDEVIVVKDVEGYVASCGKSFKVGDKGVITNIDTFEALATVTPDIEEDDLGYFVKLESLEKLTEEEI
jgi:hypothetical protein